ncbi:MAG: response regulator transcription factor [Sediminibacterium sp.]|nr:response regulator transcription factor [Sediminibacterium sp.]
MNAIIIDDEPLAREGLQLHLANIPSIKILGSFSNAIEANSFLQNEKIELIFLDINMPEISGLNFVRNLLIKPMVIFITAYPQYALDSYELDAVDYLVKPVRLERLLKAVNKAEQFNKMLQPEQEVNAVETVSDNYIFIKADRKYFKLLFKDIRYIEGLKDYVIIHIDDKKIVTAMNIKTIAMQLPAESFARISKSFIVNIAHIISFDSFNVYLKAEELPIGNNFKDDFFSNYVNGKLLKR